MNPKVRKALRVMWVLGLFVSYSIVFSEEGVADEPVLVINQAENDSTLIAVSAITHVRFDGDTMVVVTNGWEDRYDTATISRAWFRWIDPAGAPSRQEEPDYDRLLRLFQNQPNPFSPQTRIEYDVRQRGPTELSIYTVSGRRVCTLVDAVQAAGPHAVTWDGRNEDGQQIPAGIYFYRISVSGRTACRRMILLP
jgi:hypothetical protein